LGTTFILTLVFGVLTQVEKITDLISKYSPIPPEMLKITIFCILLLIPVIYLKKIYEEKQISEMSRSISTPKFIKNFLSYLSEHGHTDTFTELLVFEFIEQQFRPRNPISIILSRIVKYFSSGTINSLKDILYL